MQTTLKIAIIIGSTRPGRRGEAVGKWAHDTALAVVTELFRDWASPLADKAHEVIYWYFAEVTKLKVDVGVSEVEKQAALAGERA